MGILSRRSDPLRAQRRALSREARQLRKLIGRLCRLELRTHIVGSESEPFARQAEALLASLECIRIDHLEPAAEALERAAGDDDLLPIETDLGGESK